jgi:putative ABC transport system permease protein
VIKKLFRFPWRTRLRIESEVEAELRFHMEERVRVLMSSGLTAESAQQRAEKEFGDIEDARRYMTEVDRQAETNRRRKDYMGDLWQDITYAVRKLKSAPVFAATVILTLSVGIGGTTTVMNLINATMLRPPQIEKPGDVAWVVPMHKNGRFEQWSYPDFVDYRAQAKSWTGVVAQGNIGVTLGGADPIRLQGLAVSGDYFDVIGVRPNPGRGFRADEDVQGASAVPIVLSYPFWRRRFNNDSSIVGKTIEINRLSATVVGIAPDGFVGLRVGDDNDFWVPFAAVPNLRIGRDNLYTWRGSQAYTVVGRFKPGAEVESAIAEASVIAPRIWDSTRVERERRTLTVERIRGGLHPASRAKMVPVLSLIMVVPLLVLGVACANVANLFISRAVQRQKELALRSALGASRGRLVRQLLTECAILGLLAGVAGLAVSYGLTAIIERSAQLPNDVTRLLVPDGRVVAITFGISLAAGALFGLVPSLAATRSAIAATLKNDGIAVQVGRGRHRLRNVFVVSQMALSLTLLITAGLFVGSLQKALRVDIGFNPANVIVARFELTGQRYDTARASRFAADLLADVRGRPGVEAAGVADVLPLSGSSSSTSIRREGEPRGNDNQVQSYTAIVTSGYFETLKINVTRGRPFGATDVAGAPPVAVINERLANMLWPGQDPIGKRFLVGDRTAPVEVIGMARNSKVRSLAESTELPFFWSPDAQERVGTQGWIVVRSNSNRTEAIATVRAAFEAIDPTLPVMGLEPMEMGVARTVDGQRAGATLLGVFGVLGLVLAGFGIFGVIAQGVAARTREIGIRMSLGARAADVVRSFVREGLSLTAIGALVGVGISLALSKVLSSLLFGLTATDTLTFAGATLGLIGIAALASFVPARRAAKVDPLIALRSD